MGKAEKIVRRKLDILIHANKIEDFMIPPSNKFKWLRGEFEDFASIRINCQWRIIFRIGNNKILEDVTITDYH
jgi:toxin HigB-1